jgi:hypothetical protein
MGNFYVFFKSISFTNRDRNIKSSNQSNKLRTNNKRTVVPTTHTTIRIKRDLRLSHARLFTLLNTSLKVAGKMTSATSRNGRVLLRAMKTAGTIPDLPTVHNLGELLEIIPDRRSRGTFALRTWLLRARLIAIWLGALAVDVDGIINAMAEQRLVVLQQVIIVIISG